MGRHSESWEQTFWNAIDGHTPEAPRHVQIAKVETEEPLAVSLGGLLYEQALGEVRVNHMLLQRQEEGVTIEGCPEFGSITATVTHPAQLQAGDEVAVVQLEGKQQLIILCKVV